MLLATDVPVQTLHVAGLSTRCAVHGGGPASVLALHGWGGQIASFWPVAQGLSPEKYTVHLLDLPGFGGTALPPEPWGVAEYARFVCAYLDAQGLARVHLLGHSFGGRIGLVLGADHADRIGKMVLADSAGVRPPRNAVTDARQALIKAGKAVMTLPGLRAFYEPLRRRLYRGLGETDYLEAGALRETFVRVIEEDLLPYAARVTVPTLLIWGDRDTDTPLWQGRALEQTIPDAGLVVFSGAGHFSYLDRLPEYLRVVDHFLAGAAA